MFITLEGIEGSGKTSQLAAIAAFIQGRGRTCRITREPGGTPLGRRIRRILLDPASADLHASAELLLYLADRAQHLAAVVRPALTAGHVVISDRFVDATLVYQGIARGVAPETIERLHRLLFDDLWPDLTLLLDLPADQGLDRARRDLSSGERTADEGRFEAEDLAFHRRVRQGYLDRARGCPQRFRVIDASRPADAVWHQIRDVLDETVGGGW